MNIFILITGLIIVFLFSFFTTGFIRKYSLNHALIDIPSDRSSHTVPTPRGGGLSITIPVLLCICLLFFFGWVNTEITMALGIGGLLVAVIGWIDDHKHIPALWRAVCYEIAAGWAVFCLGGLQSIKLGNYELMLGQFGSVFAVLGIVWLTNLYNFMDGTDGIAGIEAICISLFAGVLFWNIGEKGLSVICLVIMISSCGFLCWNWAPAKIFMGDVGSCLLGFCFAVLATASVKDGSIILSVWLILMAVFIVDATLTLCMRIIKGEKWYSAHRSHAYQRLVMTGVSHDKLAISILLINVMMLWPTAYAAYRWEEFSNYFVAVALLLMSAIWGSSQFYYHRITL